MAGAYEHADRHHQQDRGQRDAELKRRPGHCLEAGIGRLIAAAGAETNLDIVGRAGNQEHRDYGTDHRREKASDGNHRLEVAEGRRSQHYRIEHAEDR
ncbi:hypothetical protein OWR29_26400 [Actinoplanes sp. Pm04-4]|uniref:Uncharacterized protein n=1 Tax=Paractinoplanes pyxinae TaxID=2997416 RepID=A0ABT4B4X0_9ACTN|nr:hypothetical protein [Actinoplanes pyxinae]MCY1141544.1 hypothetical protein [Actinoplanes pyxinae]